MGELIFKKNHDESERQRAHIPAESATQESSGAVCEFRAEMTAPAPVAAIFSATDTRIFSATVLGEYF